MLASPIAIAPASAAPQRDQREVTRVKVEPNGRTVVTTRTTRPGASNFRRWNKGQRFDRRYAQNYREVATGSNIAAVASMPRRAAITGCARAMMRCSSRSPAA